MIFSPFWGLRLLFGALGASLGATREHLGPQRDTWGRQSDSSFSQSPPKKGFWSPNVVFRALRGLQNTKMSLQNDPPGAQDPKKYSKILVLLRSHKHPVFTTLLAKKKSSTKNLEYILSS